MNKFSLLQLVKAMTPICPELEQRLIEFLKEEQFQRKHVLLREGHINRRLYYIHSGFARAFYIKDEREYTTWFMGQGDFMISVLSFFRQQPSVENIEILEDSTLLSISWQQLETLYREFPEYNLVGRKLTEAYYIQSEKRAIELRTLSAGERYQALVKSYPAVLQKASLGQIASHLGISQETLSRIRAKF